MKKTLALLLTLALAGCATVGGRFDNTAALGPNEGVVYVYRMQPVARTLDVYPGVAVNGKDVGDLKLDTYLRVPVPAGATEVKLLHRGEMWPNDAPVPSVAFALRPGETRYVQFAIDNYLQASDGETTESHVGISLREVPEGTARERMAGLREAP